jgi:hypothetical protein
MSIDTDGHDPASVRISPSTPTTAAFGWNIAVVVTGCIIALSGIMAWARADVGDSAPRQAVAALWLIQGLIGILIAAIGILGASLVSTLSMRMEARGEVASPLPQISGEAMAHFRPGEISVTDEFGFTDAPYQLTVMSASISDKASKNNYQIRLRKEAIEIYRYGTMLKVCHTNNAVTAFGIEHSLAD